MNSVHTVVTAIALSCVFSSNSLACSIVRPEPKTPEQIEAQVIKTFQAFSALVELQALTSSDNFKKPARARVLHSYKDHPKAGAIIEVYTDPGSMCGTDKLIEGTRRFAYLTPVKVGTRYMQGILQSGWFLVDFLDNASISILENHGFLKSSDL